MTGNMEEFIHNLLANSSTFIGGRTLAPGPAVASSRVHGPVVLSLEEPVGTSTQQLQHGAVRAEPFASRQDSNIMSPGSSEAAASSTSILRTDMSQMIAWLTSQNSSATDSQAGSSSSLNSQSETYTNDDYRKRIPKPYNELTSRDCAGVVAQAIGSIVLHTCNDKFRQKCLSKLGASNSRDVEREVKARLNALIMQEEQQNQPETETQDEMMDQTPSSMLGEGGEA